MLVILIYQGHFIKGSHDQIEIHAWQLQKMLVFIGISLQKRLRRQAVN